MRIREREQNGEIGDFKDMPGVVPVPSAEQLKIAELEDTVASLVAVLNEKGITP